MSINDELQNKAQWRAAGGAAAFTSTSAGGGGGSMIPWPPLGRIHPLADESGLPLGSRVSSSRSFHLLSV